MKRRVGRVIPDPNPDPEHPTRAVLLGTPGNPDPVITGLGNVNWICGACEHVLAKKLMPGQLVGIVLKCPMCAAYNDIPGS